MTNSINAIFNTINKINHKPIYSLFTLKIIHIYLHHLLFTFKIIHIHSCLLQNAKSMQSQLNVNKKVSDVILFSLSP